ncbi:MAG: GntR family transcriptional regulator [Rhodospirillaceae bacterium]|nr:GntR family transcriptional regulator [Rhodospirillaceae bacterium]
MQQGNVDRLYEAVRDMAIAFHFKPGERVNEVALARRLGVSRTPLREALNRLTAEGLLTIQPGRGFFCRTLDTDEIGDLYEVRLAIEEATVRRLCRSAPTPDLQRLRTFLLETGGDAGTRTVSELTALDETFHERLAELSGNAEMLRVLRNLNHRIRFVRWIHMEDRRSGTQADHQAILDAVLRGDEDGAVRLLQGHILRRRDQITAAVREGYARIYHDRAGEG